MNRIERYAVKERMIHALAGASFVYLLLSGLAFWTPALYWLSSVLGGGYLTRMLHPWVGLVFAGSVVAMALGWWRDMRVTPEDREWRKSMARYIRNEDYGIPPAGRFNYGQKMMFWIMVWGGLALLASGTVMWFVASVPWELHALRVAAVVVHTVAALAVIGAFIVHIYMGVAVVPGGMHAIVHGDVSEEWARHHHPLWRKRS